MAEKATKFASRKKLDEDNKRTVLRISVKKGDIKRFGETLLKKEMQAKLEAWIEEKTVYGQKI